MEPEGSLPHSPQPATCPYSEPDQSSPRPQPTSWISILVLFSHLRVCLPSGLFHIFQTKPCMQISCPTYVLRSPPISTDTGFSWFPCVLEQMLVWFPPVSPRKWPLTTKMAPDNQNGPWQPKWPLSSTTLFSIKTRSFLINQPEPDQFSPCPHPTSWTSILVLFSHLRVGLPNDLFLSYFPNKALYATFLSPIRVTFPARLYRHRFISWFPCVLG